MSRNSIKGVLHNFLETYTSRYSDYEGYWLFGMLIGELDGFNVNLLDAGCGATESAPMTAAVRLAAVKFMEQLEKAGLSLTCIREAQLSATKSPSSRNHYFNGHWSAGFDVEFVARAVSSSGKSYERKKSVFVAPHNPEVELRSTRST